MAVSTWPEGYRRAVMSMHFLKEHPLHAGRFHAFAAPFWLLAIWAFLWGASWRGDVVAKTGLKPWTRRDNKNWRLNLRLRKAGI